MSSRPTAPPAPASPCVPTNPSSPPPDTDIPPPSSRKRVRDDVELPPPSVSPENKSVGGDDVVLHVEDVAMDDDEYLDVEMDADSVPSPRFVPFYPALGAEDFNDDDLS